MNKKLTRDLRPIPLDDALRFIGRECIVTMAENQWDPLLAAAYGAGWVLLELNDAEEPVRAFQRAE